MDTEHFMSASYSPCREFILEYSKEIRVLSVKWGRVQEDVFMQKKVAQRRDNR
jgi:hypothetical protein